MYYQKINTYASPSSSDSSALRRFAIDAPRRATLFDDLASVEVSGKECCGDGERAAAGEGDLEGPAPEPFSCSLSDSPPARAKSWSSKSSMAAKEWVVVFGRKMESAEYGDQYDKSRIYQEVPECLAIPRATSPEVLREQRRSDQLCLRNCF